MDMILVAALIAAGAYITYLHTRERKHEFYRALFEATWGATWDHCEKLTEIYEDLQDYIYDVPCREAHKIEKAEFVLLLLNDQIKRMKGILNCEVDPDITIVFEDDGE